MDDFRKYEALRQQGISPVEIYLAGKKDGLDQISLIRMLRQICDLSLVEAKEVVLQAERRAGSLTEFQEGLAPIVDEALNSWDGLSPANNQPASVRPSSMKTGGHS